MDRAQLLLMGLPLFLFFSDVINLFTPPPPPPPPPKHHPHHPVSRSPLNQQTPHDFPIQDRQNLVGLGNSVTLSFCASCSYRRAGATKAATPCFTVQSSGPKTLTFIFRHEEGINKVSVLYFDLFLGTAAAMKQMLESSFPGLEVILVNHPPTLPKRVLGKLVPVFQMGTIAVVMAGEQIFPRLGFITPPAWYYSMRANRFGTIASTWLLGNFVQNFLQSSGAFEVFLNDELVFSKLKLQRFPNEVELKTIVNKRLSNSRLVEGDLDGVWS